MFIRSSRQQRFSTLPDESIGGHLISVRSVGVSEENATHTASAKPCVCLLLLRRTGTFRVTEACDTQEYQRSQHIASYRVLHCII